MSDMIAQQRTAAATIVAKLMASFSVISGQQKDASEALKTAQDATNSTREDLLRSAADASFKALWNDAAIEGAVDDVVNNSNVYSDKKATTLRTFASQLRLAMHSQVRTVLPSIFDLGTEAWNEERKAAAKDKKAPQPLQVAFSRRTHMLVTLLRNVREHGSSFPSKAAIVAFAVASDPAKDAEKVAAKLKALRKVFTTFSEEFPLPSFASIDQFLAKIDTAKLIEARAKAQASEEPAPSNLRDASGNEKPAAPAANDAPSDILGDAIADFNAAA